MFRKILATALAAAAMPAQAAWRQASTDHFVIYSEASAKDLEAYAARLERFDKAIRSLRGLPDLKPSPSNRLTVFVVPSISSVQKLYGKGGSGIAGFYSGRASGSIAITPRRAGSSRLEIDADIILFHEYAHHFMMDNYPGAFPAWLIEGFAEFHSTAQFEKDGSVGLGAPANHRAYALAGYNPLKIEKMLTASVSELKPDERDALYARGWLLTHFLTFEPSRKGQLSAYVAAINKGEKSLDAAKAAFGDLQPLDRQLDTYIRRKTLSYFKLPAERVTPGPVTVRELPAGEAAVMDVRIRSKRGVDSAGAKVLLPLARAAAAPYPKDPMAQVTLAEAEYDAGYFAEAEAAADRALAANPKFVEALIYKGRAKMAAAAAAKADSTAWKEARKWIIAANKLEPEDPEPLFLYYVSFMEEGVRPTPSAVQGLQYALALAPQDRELRMTAARQMLIDGKAAQARAALAPIAFDPHVGGMGEKVAAIIKTLDESGPKAALDAFHKTAKENEEAG
jgi:tetratricopeptide (TPR) repeat protein